MWSLLKKSITFPIALAIIFFVGATVALSILMDVWVAIIVVIIGIMNGVREYLWRSDI